MVLPKSRDCKRAPFASSVAVVACISAACVMLWLGYASKTSLFAVSSSPTIKTVTALRSSTATMAPSLSPIVAKIRTHRILAYGDSLTAGTSFPNLFPYAPYLQAELEANYPHRTNNVLVRHRGLPGWTTQGMLDDLDDSGRGLRSAIAAVTEPSLSLVILLAGTNDLAYGVTEDQIVANLLKLHSVCKESGVPRTLAIGIPPSGYQAAHPEVADLVRRINDKLQQQSTSSSSSSGSDNSTIYTPFPFDFEKRGENWHADSLHFSQKGYQLLGTSLAPIVESILESLDVAEKAGTNR